MADNMALMFLGFKDYDIEGIEDVYDKAKHYKRVSLTYSGDIPAVCPVCGNPLYKHGKRTLQVNDTPLQGCPVVLNIEIPRCVAEMRVIRSIYGRQSFIMSMKTIK